MALPPRERRHQPDADHARAGRREPGQARRDRRPARSGRTATRSTAFQTACSVGPSPEHPPGIGGHALRVGHDRGAGARAPSQQPRRQRPPAQVVVDVPQQRGTGRTGPGAEHVHLQAVGVHDVGAAVAQDAAQPPGVARRRQRRAQQRQPQTGARGQAAAHAPIPEPRQRRRKRHDRHAAGPAPSPARPADPRPPPPGPATRPGARARSAASSS